MNRIPVIPCAGTGSMLRPDRISKEKQWLYGSMDPVPAHGMTASLLFVFRNSYIFGMPELPEVETVRRGLVPWLEGECLRTVTARRPDLRFPLPLRFAEQLAGRTVARLERRAKYLLIYLDNGQVWLSHLGMSGKYRVLMDLPENCHPGACRDLVPDGHRSQSQQDPGLRRDDNRLEKEKDIQKHDHIVLTTARATIAYHDPRRFGFMDLIAPEYLATHPLLASLGPEPLGNAFHAEHLFDKARRSRAPLKALLLDQKVVAGLGNIYVAESLFRARLHPERPGHSLSRADAERLTRAIREVLHDAIAAGGSSLRDYQGPAGEFGCFQHTFAVYDRAGEPCGVCAQPIQRIVQSGRATCYCAVCQQ
jgi:formamidopyrimidine-DNA glycosylase